jgi:hypothetical protein
VPAQQRVGECDQDVVAGAVAEPVVYLLEVIEIEVRECQWTVVAFRSRHFRGERCGKRAISGDSGQRIHPGPGAFAVQARRTP